MKMSHTLAARVTILTAILFGISACSTLPEPAANESWKPASVCPLNSGFFGNQADSECLLKEQQNTVRGYIT